MSPWCFKRRAAAGGWSALSSPLTKETLVSQDDTMQIPEDFVSVVSENGSGSKNGFPSKTTDAANLGKTVNILHLYRPTTFSGTDTSHRKVGSSEAMNIAEWEPDMLSYILGS